MLELFPTSLHKGFLSKEVIVLSVVISIGADFITIFKDTWESYKYIAKDIINDYHKDEEYRKTKLKIGSLIKIIKMAPSTKAITSGFKFHNEKYPNDIWENNNSFV